MNSVRPFERPHTRINPVVIQRQRDVSHALRATGMFRVSLCSAVVNAKIPDVQATLFTFASIGATEVGTTTRCDSTPQGVSGRPKNQVRRRN